MAQRYELRRQLGRLDARQLGHHQHVALGAEQVTSALVSGQQIHGWHTLSTLFCATLSKATLPSSTRAEATAVRCASQAPVSACQE